MRNYLNKFFFLFLFNPTFCISQIDDISFNKELLKEYSKIVLTQTNSYTEGDSSKRIFHYKLNSLGDIIEFESKEEKKFNVLKKFNYELNGKLTSKEVNIIVNTSENYDNELSVTEFFYHDEMLVEEVSYEIKDGQKILLGFTSIKYDDDNRIKKMIHKYFNRGIVGSFKPNSIVHDTINHLPGIIQKSVLYKHQNDSITEFHYNENNQLYFIVLKINNIKKLPIIYLEFDKDYNEVYRYSYDYNDLGQLLIRKRKIIDEQKMRGDYTSEDLLKIQYDKVGLPKTISSYFGNRLISLSKLEYE